jgi:hypothetical protein
LLEQLDEALVEQQQAAYAVAGMDDEDVADTRKRKKAAEVKAFLIVIV